jgi:cell division inhibitor SepF
MAGFLKNIVNKISGYEEYDVYDEELEPQEDTGYEDEPADPPSFSRQNPFRARQNRVVDIKTGNGYQVVVLQPADIDTAKAVSNHVRAGRTVICNFEKVEPKVAQRVVDFITGAAFALDGQVSPGSNSIFVIVPRSVSLLQGAGEPETALDYLRHVKGAQHG